MDADLQGLKDRWENMVLTKQKGLDRTSSKTKKNKGSSETVNFIPFLALQERLSG